MLQKNNARHSARPAFTLIELLVALIVFSIGLLAIAGLQTISKRANYESLQRTVAAQVSGVPVIEYSEIRGRPERSMITALA